jgi:hypothetical protein
VDEELLDAFLSKPLKARMLLETLHGVLHKNGADGTSYDEDRE